jgi:pimeloyl-ACP methyl ester carboxylesterase
MDKAFVDVPVDDGRILRAYDNGLSGEKGVVVWHHGSPQTGALLEPLLVAAAERGIRLLSYARPGYAGSSRLPGRNVASAARDVEDVADAFGVERFAVMGASGGGPHAIACAALAPERVSGVVSLAGPAPFTEEFDWYAGMAAPGGL